ncbi:hypothetical protein SETIT_2G430200v2 [Setaria italica]|uniref:Uncharacterized protein n=1 Tax=Setaria italica TaxID=4555 RepID=A0A368Q9V0_SETIT|nr:hypothetical protein SETIT_2G430200v2 [Setaria italica]
MIAAATAPTMVMKLTTEEAAPLPAGVSVGAPAGVETEVVGVIAEGAGAVGASLGGAGGEAIGDSAEAVGGFASGDGALAGDRAGGGRSGAILGAGVGVAAGACAAAVTARSATMAATTANWEREAKLLHRFRLNLRRQLALDQTSTLSSSIHLFHISYEAKYLC